MSEAQIPYVVMDELMETIRQIHPKLYRMVMEKL